MAVTVDLEIPQKATFKKRFAYRDARKRPIDLTGVSARMALKLDYDDSEPLLELSTDPDGGITILDKSGVIDIEMTAGQTADLDFEAAVYDLKLVWPSGSEQRLVQGQVTLSRGVTE